MPVFLLNALTFLGILLVLAGWHHANDRSTLPAALDYEKPTAPIGE
jgi:hypothetical protein